MAVNLKRVFYVRRLFDPSFAELLAKRPDIALDKVDPAGDAAEARPILEAAHVFQISSARDDRDRNYFATESLLKRTPNLVAVSASGAGYDTVDVAACTAAGVIAVNQSGANREAVAEHVLGMVICLSKRIMETDRVMRRDDGMDRNAYMGHDVLGRTIGIVGLGNTGGRVAELAGGLLAMRVLAYDPYLSAETMRQRGAEKVDLETLLKTADFVSINCPLTDETRGMIGVKQYALMQPDAFLIVTARGGICDELALADALHEKRIAGAGIDVWATEPPSKDHPLLKLDNVLASPHSAGATFEARSNLARFGAEQIITILDGGRPPRLLNPEVWPAYCRRFERILGFAPRS